MLPGMHKHAPRGGLKRAVYCKGTQEALPALSTRTESAMDNQDHNISQLPAGQTSSPPGAHTETGV